MSELVSMHCWRCRCVLGHTDGTVLRVCGVEFTRTVTFTCVCGKRKVWVPHDETRPKKAARVLVVTA